MSLSGHLAELSQKHRVLEQKLQDALIHPSTSDAELAQLKREKLKIKDEIQRLSGKDETQH